MLILSYGCHKETWYNIDVHSLEVPKPFLNFRYYLDINECPNGTDTHLCDRNATCTDNHGSYECTCNVGYTGHGWDGNCTSK